MIDNTKIPVMLKRFSVTLFSLFTFLLCYSQNDTTVMVTSKTVALTVDRNTKVSRVLHVPLYNYGQLPSKATVRGADKPDEVYLLKPAVDIPVTAAGIAWCAYAFPKIYDKPYSDIRSLNNLKKEDLNVLDRWAAGMYDNDADATSDIFFYGSIPTPLLLLADHDMRKDAGKIAFMYLEAMAVTGLFYTGTAHFVDRYRPYAYDPNVPLDERLTGNAKNSFLGGHPALVATATFFTAKVFGDYHPDSKLKWVFYGGAIAATGTTAYLRHKAGRHFPTDLLTGTTLGVLSGILVPHFHKNKAYKGRMTVLPYTGNEHGLTVLYKL
jgi:membrane-associated phospholipid phosphatase